MPRQPSSSLLGRVLTADEVAEVLRVDRKTVYDAAARGEIPHRRLGRRLLFNEAAVLLWLAGDLASVLARAAPASAAALD